MMTIIGDLTKLRDAEGPNTPRRHRLIGLIVALRKLPSEHDPDKRWLLHKSINDHMGWLERRGE